MISPVRRAAAVERWKALYTIEHNATDASPGFPCLLSCQQAGSAVAFRAIARRTTLRYSAFACEREQTLQTTFVLAVIMRKRMTGERWQTEQWEPVAVVVESHDRVADSAERFADADGSQLWLFHGLRLILRPEEAEGYYLNISTQQPRVFVHWEQTNELAVPQRVTASYDNACTWLDAGDQVASVAMPPDVYDVLSEFTRMNYRPEPKKRIRPRSFQTLAQAPRFRRD